MQLVWNGSDDFDPCDLLQFTDLLDGEIGVELAPDAMFVAQIKRFQPAIVSRVKILSHLNIAEKRLPQDGRIKMNIAGKHYDLRVSVLPSVHGQSVVMRILDRGNISVSIKELGFAEDDYLREVARHFGFDAGDYARIRAHHVGVEPDGWDDPYAILGVEPGAALAAIRDAYYQLVRESHPDLVIAQGLPPECIALATARIARINAAYDRLARDGARLAASR